MQTQYRAPFFDENIGILECVVRFQVADGYSGVGDKNQLLPEQIGDGGMFSRCGDRRVGVEIGRPVVAEPEGEAGERPRTVEQVIGHPHVVEAVGHPVASRRERIRPNVFRRGRHVVYRQRLGYAPVGALIHTEPRRDDVYGREVGPERCERASYSRRARRAVEKVVLREQRQVRGVESRCQYHAAEQLGSAVLRVCHSPHSSEPRKQGKSRNQYSVFHIPTFKL